MMRRSVRSIVAAAAVTSFFVGSSPAHAAVPKEFQTALSRVKSLLGRCKQLDGDVSARQLEGIVDNLDKAKGFAKDFPADVPELAEATRAIAACEQAVQKARGASDDAEAKREADNAALVAGAQKDLENVQSMTAALAELDQSVGSTAEHMRGAVLEDLKSWQKVREESKRLVAAYGALKAQGKPNADRRMEIDPAATTMWRAVAGLKSSLAGTEARIAAFAKDAPDLARQAIDVAEKGATAALASRDARAFTGPIRNSLATARFTLDQAEVLATQGEAVDAGQLAAERARIAKVVDQGKALAEEIIKSNTLPKDAYAGSDRAAVQAAVTKAWLASNPQSPPLKVIVWASEWSRYKKLVWSDASKGWVKQDYSNLGASVVFKRKDGKYAYFVDVIAQKNHLNGDKLGAVAMPCESSEMPADSTVLLGAVK